MTDGSLTLLSDQRFAPALAGVLRQANPDAQVTCAHSLADIHASVADPSSRHRLVAFCTDIIVPADILSRCKTGAYNFHPGPPEYPGIYPSCFAIYDGADRFGSTAHEMTEIVDQGAIVATDHFEISSDIDRFALDALAFESVMRLFQRLAPQLVTLDNPLRPSDEQWSGRARTKKDFSDLCLLPKDVDRDEFERRYRAVGEGPNHALTVNIYGHQFRLDNQRSKETVFRGGQVSSG